MYDEGETGALRPFGPQMDQSRDTEVRNRDERLWRMDVLCCEHLRQKCFQSYFPFTVVTFPECGIVIWKREDQ